MLSLLLVVSFLSIVLAQIVSLHGTPDLPSSNALVEHGRAQPDFRHTPPQPTGPDLTNDLELLDIVLLASVDGKFHAINRTSGRKLWSMAPDSSTSAPGPTALSPLVRTHHIDHDPETTDESTQQEAYIIEPQSGDIYVMTDPSSPLQRFPFTMQELVDISPTSFKGEFSHKSFVGKKESSLLVVELETGKIKATLNSECPWDQFEDFRDDGSELDLDELEGNKPPKPPVTEVYIGRTDYHVSIITRPLNRDTPYTNRPQIQNLSFSMYGPNKQDIHLQNIYRHTNDNVYVQGLPNGETFSFKARSTVDPAIQAPNAHFMWGLSFNQPIVAVFDVLRRKPDHHMGSHPIVLLQPRPKIQDIFPGLSTKENLSNAYVGFVKETGSLFAMSPQRYPLVPFSQTKQNDQGRLIDSSNPDIFVGRPGDRGGGDQEVEEPVSVDEITRLRKQRDAAMRAQEEELQCHDRIINDRRCLVGVRKLELDVGNGAETRMKRLIDPPAEPSLEEVFGQQQQQHNTGYEGHQSNATGGSEDGLPLTIDPPRPSDVVVPAGASGWGFWETLSGTLILGILSFWFLKNRGRWSQLVAMVENRRVVVTEPQLPSLPPPPQEERKPEPQEVELQKEKEVVVPNGATPEPKIIQPRIPQGEDKSDWQMVEVPTPPSSVDGGSSQSTPSTAVPTTPTPEVMSAPGDETDREDGGATEVEDEAPTKNTEATPKKRTRRGKRGAKKPKGAANGEATTPNNSANGGNGGGKTHGKGKEKEKDNEDVEETKTSQPSLVLASSAKSNVATVPSLMVSETVLGYGSHGTVVFQGSLQGRAVAVKRLLADFVTLASREVSILQESDDHPNVIRYYYQEAQAGFLYIALELCPASLADLIETPDRDAWRDIAVSFDPKRALKQVTNGLRHLHGLKLVHRDIKPQNILVSMKGVGTISGKSNGGVGTGGAGAGARGAQYRMLISDFGLCKKLDVDQTSFLPTAHGAMAAGTVGWRAPEILSGEVKLNELSDDQSMSSRGSTATINGNSSVSSTSSNNSANGGKGRTRLTKSVDIFALGCLYYYTLTGGGHPFGDRYEREVNIMKNAKNLELLERFGEEGTEAADLIEKMLDPIPSERPDTVSCLLHPFFWDSSRRLNFLQDASDRFEIMCRDPKDPRLVALEKNAQNVVGNDWHSRLDRVFIDNLGKFRKYDGKSIQDLLRALRNKKHHYQDLPDNVKRHLGSMPDGYLAYFTRRYPNLFLHVHQVVKETGLVEESMFRNYFELPES